ncbi:MAG: flagellar hook protein FlgE [Sulfurospirillum sp.]|nr:flagellar hook protein FlgE [Sulfurospirillum sp.]
MNTSFYNGISGVKSHQFGLDVWADNIANINTTGFISKTPEFSTVFSTTLANSYFNPTANDFGYGSGAQNTALNTFRQGIFQPTDRTFDMAIDGKGFFGVQSQTKEILYTRAGAFSIDANGDMVDESGNYLMGTLGGNITPTMLNADLMNQFGQYYQVDNTTKLGTAYSIASLGDIALTGVANQSIINLPDILYFPPEATTYVNYQANLNPKIITEATLIDINETDFVNSIDTLNKIISINGSITNTLQAQNPQKDDVVLVTLRDANGKTLNINTKLDENLTWNIINADISTLDTTNPITTTAQLQSIQEIPNIEHFTTEIIAPDGKKDIVDMTFTKRVPQDTLETTWDTQIQVLRFVEDYKIQSHDPNITYDPAIYDVNLTTNQVTKIYDPTLYKVDKGLNKVYQIIDSKEGSATFGGGGELRANDIPTLSNSGTPLNLNIGTPLTQDGDVIISNGFDGMISHVDLDKARVSTKDGYVEGLLKAYGMDGRGNIIAEFSNGRSTPIAKVAIYQFINEQGLANVTTTLFSKTDNSGEPLFFLNADGSYKGSLIRSNYLEGSNVLYATALTELLIMQKAFDASAKSITTSDQLIQNAINMKR